MIVVIDNYDSFTYNLVQYLGELGAEVDVRRNDTLSVADAAALKPERIMISPGPCTPNEAGICLDLIKTLGGKLPILGVCLGHQAIGEAYGGEVVRAERVMHGKTSQVRHDGTGIFAGLPSPMEVMRYHSLIVERNSIPESLEITAKTWQDEIMGVRHKSFAGTKTPVEGVQFHPESILTPMGSEILRNFMELK